MDCFDDCRVHGSRGSAPNDNRAGSRDWFEPSACANKGRREYAPGWLLPIEVVRDIPTVMLPETHYTKNGEVHIAYQVMGQGPLDLVYVPGAQPGEVLVSSTVRDLVAGSGLSFDDRGARSLKGVPNEWHLFAANG